MPLLFTGIASLAVVNTRSECILDLQLRNAISQALIWSESAPSFAKRFEVNLANLDSKSKVDS
jgi:hypothetical protein